MATAATARSMPRFATRGVLLAVVVVLFAMVALALLAEALTNGDGGTVYLAEIQPGSAMPGSVPSLVVVGYGKASIEAETAEIQLLVSNEETGYPGGSFDAPTPGATPGDAEREAAAPIVAAIVGAGAPQDAVRVVTNRMFRSRFGPPGARVFRIDVTLAGPDREQVAAVVDAAEVGAVDAGFRITGVGVGYGVADCAALRSQSWDAAVDDARTRASAQADALGLTLGELLVAQETAVGDAANLLAAPSATFGCAPAGSDAISELTSLLYGSSGVAVSVPPFDPTRPATVEAFAQVSLAFEVVRD